MYQIVNDICSICSQQFWSEATEKVKQDNPKWLTKAGYIRSNNLHAFANKKKQEYTKLNPGPVTCCQIVEDLVPGMDYDLWDNQKFNICIKHLKEIVAKAEHFDAGEEI